MHQINPINQRRDEIAEVAKLIDSKHYFEDSNLNSIEKQLAGIKESKLMATQELSMLEEQIQTIDFKRILQNENLFKSLD